MPRRPNILWYCSDQQRFDTLGRWGNPHIHTPRLDRFAGESVSLTRTYCQSPICTPSRASFLTGMYPSAVAVDGNGIPRFPASYAERLITRQLADARYDCGNVGKLHLATAAGRQEPRVADGYRYFRVHRSWNLGGSAPVPGQPSRYLLAKKTSTKNIERPRSCPPLPTRRSGM